MAAALPQVETIESAGRTICLIVRRACDGAETAFFTPPELALQVGRIVHAAGSRIAPHVHPRGARSVSGTTEVLVVHRGRTLLDLYEDDGTALATRELAAGDIAILVSGGHGLRQLEDTVLVEVKQGPYGGAADKEPL